MGSSQSKSGECNPAEMSRHPVLLEICIRRNKACLHSFVLPYGLETGTIPKMFDLVQELKGEVTHMTVICTPSELVAHRALIPNTVERLGLETSLVDWASPASVAEIPDASRVIDFPLELVQSLPRLRRLDILWVYDRIEKIPLAVLDTSIEYLNIQPGPIHPYPYWLLYRNPPIHPKRPGDTLYEECDALRVLILLGLEEAKDTSWSRFLKRGLYDPRLFLFVFDWLAETSPNK